MNPLNIIDNIFQCITFEIRVYPSLKHHRKGQQTTHLDFLSKLISNKMRKIIVFGDSIVFGRKVNISSNWVSKLNAFFRDRFEDETLVYNLGVPGETSGDILSRIKNEITSRLKNQDPSDFTIILIATGLNDSKIINKKAQTLKTEFKNNIKKIIEISKKHADIVVYVGPIKVSENIASDFDNKLVSEYSEIAKKICSSQKVSFVDLLGNWPSSEKGLYTNDGVHPTEKGHAFIFSKISKSLKSLT